jgi:hypothetical protein
MLTKATFTIWSSIALVACLGGFALGAPLSDYFEAEIQHGRNALVPITSTAFNGGEWFEYPQPVGPSWWNQWFLNGGQWIEYDMILVAPPAPPGSQPFPSVEVAINWSTPEWTDSQLPPIPGSVPNPDDFIVRQQIFSGSVAGGFVSLENIGDPIDIPDFVPVWVSIDVRRLETGEAISSPVYLEGNINHDAIPEPSSVVLTCLILITMSRPRRLRA